MIHRGLGKRQSEPRLARFAVVTLGRPSRRDCDLLLRADPKPAVSSDAERRVRTAMKIAKFKDITKLADIAKLKDQLAVLQRKAAPEEDEPGPDPREVAIEGLEREIEQEREHAVELRRTIDELQFKIEILEKSYSKQLQDARDRATKAEAQLAAQTAQATDLGGTPADLAKTLAKLREELEQVTKERDRLRRSTAPNASPLQAPGISTDDEALLAPEALSIDQILEDAVWAREQERINKERGAAHGHEPANEEPPLEDLLAPDLVFAGKDGED